MAKPRKRSMKAAIVGSSPRLSKNGAISSTQRLHVIGERLAQFVRFSGLNHGAEEKSHPVWIKEQRLKEAQRLVAVFGRRRPP